MDTQPGKPVIRCDGVWKVFGSKAKEAIRAAKLVS